MGAMTHVTRRGASYVWRRRIPKHALPRCAKALSTKNSGGIIQVSLSTRDLSTAARRAPLVTAAFDDIIEGMTQTTLTRAQLREYLEAVIQAEIQRLETARWRESLPTSTREWRGRWMRDRAEAYALRLLSSRGPTAEVLPEDMDRLRAEGFQPQDMAMVAEALFEFTATPEGDTSHAKPEPKDVIGHAPTSELDQMMLTREAFRGAALAREQLDRRRAELAGFGDGHCGFEASLDRSSVGPASPRRSTSVKIGRYSPEIPRIIDRMDAYDRRHGAKQGKAKKTIESSVRQRRRALEQFSEAVNKDRITDLRVDDLAYYVSCLARLPLSYNKSPTDRDLTLAQHMERGDDLPSDQVGLSGNTINRNLTFISTMLKHAKKEGLYPAEPLDVGLYRTKHKKLARDQRPSFTLEDVRRIFTHPTWLGRKSAARPHSPGAEITKDAIFWVPLIAAYSGLRREEICGLRLKDVADTDPVPHFVIRQNVNRGLKNAQSQRSVPLHPHLIELGFPEHCAQLRAAGDLDLFPDLRPADENRTFGDALHHRWRELLKRQIGPDTGGKVFHSFRHYVISQLKQSRADIDLVRELVGHLHGNVTEDRYADAHDLNTLAELVSRLPRVF